MYPMTTLAVNGSSERIGFFSQRYSCRVGGLVGFTLLSAAARMGGCVDKVVSYSQARGFHAHFQYRYNDHFL